MIYGIEAPILSYIKVRRTAIHLTMRRIDANNIVRSTIARRGALGFVDQLCPCVGTLEFEAPTEPFSKQKLQSVIKGIAGCRDHVVCIPIRIEPRIAACPELPSIGQNLRNRRIALF